ncbi:cobalamin biosynthesis protein CbiG [Actinoplanes lutulentus]|uniref:Cobalt-precorrin 5A hydrolase n=1 Tax=Actinoplanes lutulentus TaxID=1287878 RepID=A0A327ZIL0_9ACTN|nr:cobalamin biosynthesis protein [Actinoplanes lutulentus]MBB2944075.1 cobalamin biosynthesis protein CbiG [Actinoplanes lutulentus]RAK42692.1 cobalt-precorrin 5A hydrolase [Actinoplanes lutulentus]
MIVVGLGSRTGVTTAALAAAVREVLADAGLAFRDVTALATLDRRATSPEVRVLATEAGWRLVGYSADELAGVEVPSPSATVAAVTGTPSVAEAAALIAAGPKGGLMVPKRIIGTITVAVATDVSSVTDVVE